MLKGLLKAVVAIGVSLGALAWSFHDVNLEDIASGFGRTSTGAVAMFALAQIVIHAIRVVRWALLVRPLGRPGHRAIFAAASIGIPMAFFLPLRLGELVRPAIIARRGVPFAGAVASVVVERVTDGMLNVMLFFVLLSWLPASGPVAEEVRTLSSVAMFVFSGAVGVLFLAYVTRGLSLPLFGSVLARVSPAAADRAVRMLGAFFDGLSVLKSPLRAGGFIGLTLVYWLINGTATLLFARCYAPDLPFIAGLFTVSVSVFAIMLPAAPGAAGTLEAAIRLALAPFGVEAATALVIAIGLHVIQLIMLALFTGAGIWANAPASARGAQPDANHASSSQA